MGSGTSLGGVYAGALDLLGKSGLAERIRVERTVDAAVPIDPGFIPNG